MEKKSIIEEVKKILDKHLELKGQRKTPERYAIINEIYSFKHHFDADELYSQMIKKKYTFKTCFSLDTITSIQILQEPSTSLWKFGSKQLFYNIVGKDCMQMIWNETLDIYEWMNECPYKEVLLCMIFDFGNVIGPCNVCDYLNRFFSFISETLHKR